MLEYRVSLVKFCRWTSLHDNRQLRPSLFFELLLLVVRAQGLRLAPRFQGLKVFLAQVPVHRDFTAQDNESTAGWPLDDDAHLGSDVID